MDRLTAACCQVWWAFYLHMPRLLVYGTLLLNWLLLAAAVLRTYLACPTALAHIRLLHLRQGEKACASYHYGDLQMESRRMESNIN